MAGPFFVGMKIYENLFSFFRRSPKGVYNETSGEERGGHAVTLTGWGRNAAGEEHWLMRNSWGPLWADGGYFRIVMHRNLCEIESRALTVAYPEEHSPLPEWIALDEEVMRRNAAERERAEAEARRSRDRRVVSAHSHLQLTRADSAIDFGEGPGPSYHVLITAECNRPCEASDSAADWSSLPEALTFASSRRVDDIGFEVILDVDPATLNLNGEEVSLSLFARTALRVGSVENADILVGANLEPQLCEKSLSLTLPKGRPLAAFSWITAVSSTAAAVADALPHGDWLLVNCSRPCLASWSSATWSWASGPLASHYEEGLSEAPRRQLGDRFTAFDLNADQYQRRGDYQFEVRIDENGGPPQHTVLHYNLKWLRPEPADGGRVHTLHDAIR